MGSRGGRMVFLPPPTMQTSTWSLSRSIEFGSKESSGVAMNLRRVVENNLVCGILLAAGHEERSSVRLARHVVSGSGYRDCGLESGLAVRARRAGILAGVDMTSVVANSVASDGGAGEERQEGMRPQCARGIEEGDSRFSQSPALPRRAWGDRASRATMALSQASPWASVVREVVEVGGVVAR